MKTLPEVLVLPRGPGAFVAGNPFTRTWALGDVAWVELLGAAAADAPREQIEAAFAGREFRVRDASRSPFAGGLLGDPTGLDRDASLDGVEPIDAEAAVALALKLDLIVEDEAGYAASFGPRQNVLDRGRRGTMHQQVGEYVVFKLRQKDPDAWWVSQKFTEDHREPRAGAYRYVQWPFMQAEYGERDMLGKRVLDFGSGPGLFARLFASRGAQVLAVDTNHDHLAETRQLAGADGLDDRIDTQELLIPVERTLDPLRDAGERFDLIFLSDVMMFYFHPYDPSLQLDPAGLLKSLRPLLTDGGSIAVLEPQGTFWQQAWLGSAERPMTVVTEYRNRRYGVTPTLEGLSRAAEAAGLQIARVRELVADREAPDADPLGAAFAAEFPIWWFFDLRAA